MLGRSMLRTIVVFLLVNSCHSLLAQSGYHGIQVGG